MLRCDQKDLIVVYLFQVKFSHMTKRIVGDYVNDFDFTRSEISFVDFWK